MCADGDEGERVLGGEGPPFGGDSKREGDKVGELKESRYSAMKKSSLRAQKAKRTFYI